MDFEGKVALVTGGGRGIGKAAATKFAEGGADIVIADIDPQTAKDTAEQISALGVRAFQFRWTSVTLARLKIWFMRQFRNLGQSIYCSTTQV